MDTEQVFQLIDRILPFEACLYYQVLPLAVESGRLRLGMVMLDDMAALDYVRRMVGYMNYVLAPQSLSSETHYATLSAYLNHVQAKKKTQAKPTEPAPQLEAASPPKVQKSMEPKSTISDFHAKDTLVLDSPDELDWDNACPLPPTSTSIKGRESPKVRALPPLEPTLPTLEISLMYLHSPLEELGKLPPTQLLKELLGRILMDGIGRLYFERQATCGRVLSSQNGVLQSVIEQLPLHVFQGLIEELKQLTHLPMKPVKQVQQVEIERMCQRNRILLRLRIMPGAHGEEATLQVLRGAALKFYQQQQLTNLSRDALSVAKQLQQKVSQIRDRTRKDSQLVLDQSLVKPTLSQVVEIMEQQLEDLKHLQEPH